MSRVELAGAILNVLLVEESPGDVRLTREAFQAVNSTSRLQVAVDGGAYLTKPVALEYFEGLIQLTDDFWLTAANLPQRMSTVSFNRSKTSLPVEDSPVAVRLTEDPFRNADTSIEMHVGVEHVDAKDFFSRRNERVDPARSKLVPLDPNLPRPSGGEVVSRIKSAENLELIPTVTLTTSAATEDIVWGLHAIVYVSKPVLFDDLEELLRGVRESALRRPLLQQGSM